MIVLYIAEVTKNGEPFENPVLSNPEYLAFIHKIRNEINNSTKYNNTMKKVEN